MNKLKMLILTLMITILGTSVVSAAPSPTAKPFYSITFNNNDVQLCGGSVKYSTDNVEEGKPVTITALPDKNNTFYKWKIVGKYEIVSGSLSDEKLVIKPLSQLSITAIFKDEDGNIIKVADNEDVIDKEDTMINDKEDVTNETINTNNTNDTNNSSTSPKTGDNSAIYGFLTLLLSLIISILIFIKIKIK